MKNRINRQKEGLKGLHRVKDPSLPQRIFPPESDSRRKIADIVSKIHQSIAKTQENKKNTSRRSLGVFESILMQYYEYTELSNIPHSKRPARYRELLHKGVSTSMLEFAELIDLKDEYDKCRTSLQKIGICNETEISSMPTLEAIRDAIDQNLTAKQMIIIRSMEEPMLLLYPIKKVSQYIEVINSYADEHALLPPGSNQREWILFDPDRYIMLSDDYTQGNDGTIANADRLIDAKTELWGAVVVEGTGNVPKPTFNKFTSPSQVYNYYHNTFKKLGVVGIDYPMYLSLLMRHTIQDPTQPLDKNRATLLLGEPCYFADKDYGYVPLGYWHEGQYWLSEFLENLNGDESIYIRYVVPVIKQPSRGGKE